MNRCVLCEKESEIQLSHIIPKYVFKWMKNTGTERLRLTSEFEKPIQDGMKKHLLCKSCEGKFGVYENRFKKNVFDKYLINSSDIEIEENNIDIKYFTVFTLWKVIAFFLGEDIKTPFKEDMNKAFSDWKEFLLTGKEPLNYNFYIYFLPDDLSELSFGENVYTYLHRAVDIDIATGGDLCFIYAKFSRFILLGEVVNLPSQYFTGCNLSNVVKSNSQKITHEDFWRFIETRLKFMKNYYDLPERQKIRNDNYFKENEVVMKKSDYWKALKRDL